MFDVIIAAGGKSLRAKTDKLASCLGESTVIARTVENFRNVDCINNIIVATDGDYDLPNVTKVSAGLTRANSVQNALKECKSEYVLIHDGARPFVSKDLIIRVMQDTAIYRSSVPCIKITDSLRRIVDGEIKVVDRENYLAVQTPQGYARDDIIKAYANATADDLAYDESELYAKYVGKVHVTQGECENKKITSPYDVGGYNMKTGVGYDVHRYEIGARPLILGGIKIKYEKGVVAHSDGDVVVHAVMDSLLSAINERDIGVLFPDDDTAYENADSLSLLAKVKTLVDSKNAKINNISVAIMAQAPKLKNFIPLMQRRLAETLNLSHTQITISATTTETIGVIGEEKGIACLAICSIA